MAAPSRSSREAQVHCLLAHLSYTWVLPTIHRGGPLVLGHFLLFSLLLRDYLTLFHSLLLPFLLQVGVGEQANYGCGRKKGRGESKGKL